MSAMGGKLPLGRYHDCVISSGHDRADDRIASGYRYAAWACWLTPPMVLSPLLLPILEPSSLPEAIHDGWELYLLLFGLPWALGAAFWMHARRLKSRR